MEATMRKSKVLGRLGAGLGWGVSLLAWVGCQESEARVGPERASLDLGSCLGTDCATTGPGGAADEPDFQPCSIGAATLQDELVFSATRSVVAPDQMRVAAD